MDSLIGVLMICVVVAILVGVPYFIARLTTKTVLKGKSEGIQTAGFVVAFVISLAATLFVLMIGAAMTFHR